MFKKKISRYFPGFLIIALSIGMAGCYTQFSRPTVDNDYYADDDDAYAESYQYYDEDEYQDADSVMFRYSDVYVVNPEPYYYGPEAWDYWSPYYRWHRPGWYGYYDPWYGNLIVIGGWHRHYDPFWDPWWDDWMVYNYMYSYHPNRYYWHVDPHRGYARPERRVKREVERRESPVAHRMKKREKSIEETRLKKPSTGNSTDRDGIIARPTRRPTAISGEREKRPISKPSVISRPKTENPTSRTVREPVARRAKPEQPSKNVREPEKKPSPPQSVRRSKPAPRQAPKVAPKSDRDSGSKGSSVSKPSPRRSAPSYRPAPPPPKSSGGNHSGSSGSKSSGSSGSKNSGSSNSGSKGKRK
ncbi:hypothetical protein JW960_09760 [candidate division KSB1 bacterium]|nr:hypothetical protein [candidate division KSB1 bacterium]